MRRRAQVLEAHAALLAAREGAAERETRLAAVAAELRRDVDALRAREGGGFGRAGDQADEVSPAGKSAARRLSGARQTAAGLAPAAPPPIRPHPVSHAAAWRHAGAAAERGGGGGGAHGPGGVGAGGSPRQRSRVPGGHRGAAEAGGAAGRCGSRRPRTPGGGGVQAGGRAGGPPLLSQAHQLRRQRDADRLSNSPDGMCLQSRSSSHQERGSYKCASADSHVTARCRQPRLRPSRHSCSVVVASGAVRQACASQSSS